jgi:hypothetical protein
MATEPTIYDQAALALGGKLLVEATTISVIYLDSDEAIPLLGLTINDSPRRGVVISPGGRMMQIDVEEARPIAGATVDILELYLDASETEMTVMLLGSGETLITRGFVRSPKIDAGVGQALSVKWSFLGYAAKFEAS